MITALLGLSLLISPARAQDEPPQEWDARLTSVSGDVTLFAQGSEDAEGVPAAVDAPLVEGDRVRTGDDGSAEISLDGESVIRLGPNSDFKLTNAHRSQTLFELAAGTFLAKIKKLMSAQSMQVKTPTAVAAVRGTEFGVEVPSPDESHVGVFDEGKVEVKGSAGTENLIGNQETRVGKDGRPAQPYQLQRFIKHRAAVRGFKRRIAALRKNWKRLPVQERLARRKAVLEKMRERRKKLREKKIESREKRREDRGKKERENMERFREKIRRERGGR